MYMYETARITYSYTTHSMNTIAHTPLQLTPFKDHAAPKRAQNEHASEVIHHHGVSLSKHSGILRPGSTCF